MKEIYLDNSWEFVWPGVRKNTGTGEVEVAGGVTGLTARISATDSGNAIHSDLNKALTERTSEPGEYFAVVTGDKLRLHLAALVGQIVFEVFGDGISVVYSVPRRVVDRRRA